MRLLPPSSSSIAMPGCQLRSLELRCRALPLDEVLEAQVPRGVWKCNKCKRYNPPAKRLEKPLCYCGVVRPSSAARPKDDKDDEHPGLTVVVADSFQELVIDSERHVFLDVYADWCGPCLQAKPHFHKLAALLRACDDIGICGYDADANEKPTKYIPESTIPVFKLFVRGDKQNPISFKGERTLRGFLAFLKQHTKLDIQDALRLLYADYCFQNDIEDLYRYFLASLAAQLDKNHQLPSHLLRWAEQYFLDPDRFYPVKDSDDAWQVAKKDVPSSLLPEALRPLQPGTKVRVTKDEATLERTQRQVMGFIHNRCARKELLGQVGTVVVAESHRTEVQVQFSPELVAPMRSERRYGHHAREIERLEKQGIVMLHRQALEIEAEAVSAAPRRKSKWIEVWEKVPAVEKDRLHEVVVRMDLQLMNAQPSDPRSYLIHAITDGNPLTTSTVYPRFLSEPCPERVAVKAPKPLGKQEANEAWTDLEKALFLPDIFGQLGSGGDESRLQLVKQLLIRRSAGEDCSEN
ncbi:unnamed protein product [Cladocopium goreaui]|uniref:Ubiquitinyl hydrolase 1 n=1 Tax=Cladocopium goreaui TaxID=2562237 RepID=A0A9P1CBE6_9DINO|nr:unnamed protein product [Cladocopium goreaui]